MRILKLTAENFKKLRAVEITPTGEMVLITGRNGAGKTSVLDAIWAVLKNAEHIQAMPIRKGQKQARLRLDLGEEIVELIAERRYTDKGSVLTVESASGQRFTSPQAMLDKLLGALAFDPLAFVNQEPREQFESLRKIVPLEVDLDQLDGLNRKDFDARTEINRQAKSLRAQADGIAVPDKLPTEAVDTAALKNRMGQASEIAAAIERTRAANAAEVDRVRRRHATIADEIQAARDKVKEAGDAIHKMRAEAARLEVDARELALRTDQREAEPDEKPTHHPEPAPVDVAAIRAELDQAEVVNRGIEQRGRKSALTAEATVLETKASELTDMLEARTKAKANAIAKAPMPVPGLSFGDGVVTFEGVPFGQASSAEQLKVSVAIAMAANPKLRVIRIKEGSLLDDDNIALIAGMAKAQDYDVWMEKVDTSGKIGVVIEDGMVVAVDGEPVEAAKESA
jgi:DNA repair exonuclease SbcCD ATPase subunit